VTAACAGLGLAFILEDHVRQQLADRRLVRVLDDWCRHLRATTCTTRADAISRPRSHFWSALEISVVTGPAALATCYLGRSMCEARAGAGRQQPMRDNIRASDDRALKT